MSEEPPIIDSDGTSPTYMGGPLPGEGDFGSAESSPPLYSAGESPTYVDDALDRLMEEGSADPGLVREQKSVLLRPGDVVDGRFEVEAQLGFGGMGAVYRVRDRATGQTRALKVMLPSLLSSEAARGRFVSEVTISQRLAHDGVVRVHDLGTDQARGVQYFTMEYIEGKTLHRVLQEKGGRLGAGQTVRLGIELCGILAYAHRHTIHRDLKPQNIMIQPDGKVNVLDFGLAKLMSPGRMTKSSMALGTAYYQAPEQSVHLRELDPRADLYSLGVMLYQALTGQIPLGRVKPPSALCADVPPELDEVVLKCLEPYPEDRQGSAAELDHALRDAWKAARRRDEEARSGAARKAEEERRAREATEAAQRKAEEERRAREAAEEAQRKAEEERRVSEEAEEEERFAREDLERLWREDLERQWRAAASVPRPPSSARPGVSRGKGPFVLLVVVSLLACAGGGVYYLAQTEPMQQRQRQIKASGPPLALTAGQNPGEMRTIDLGDGEKLELVWIPPGTFLMGSPEGEEGRDDDEGQHRVTISKGFWMGKHEVTQGQWEAVTGGNPSWFKGDKRLPVEKVSWEDCQEFLRNLNAKMGGRYRLPTEAEWEYACRAGTTTPFHFGETISTEQANYDGNYTCGSGRKGVYREKTVPAGSFPANAWGLHDMHGNVWEWCEDWYGDYPRGEVTDPTGPTSGSFRVRRGGSWGSFPGYCRSANRFRCSPENRGGALGFRLASSAVQ